MAIWRLTEGDSPLVAVAVHDGHAVRGEVAALLALNEKERRHEEDPFTGRWATIAETQIVGLRSRFEVDLNRPREQAVYLQPANAWGLRIWKKEPPAELIARSLAGYDAFYADVQRAFADLQRRFGRFVVFDLHTYNHRREGPHTPPADPEQNPEVNIGTGTMDRQRWAPVVDRFIADLRAFDFLGRRLDVRENVRFRGGHFRAGRTRPFRKRGARWPSSSRSSSWTNGPANQTTRIWKRSAWPFNPLCPACWRS